MCIWNNTPQGLLYRTLNLLKRRHLSRINYFAVILHIEWGILSICCHSRTLHIFKSTFSMKFSYKNNNMNVKLSFMQQKAWEQILPMSVDRNIHNITPKVLPTLHYKFLPLYSGNYKNLCLEGIVFINSVHRGLSTGRNVYGKSEIRTFQTDWFQVAHM